MPSTIAGKIHSSTHTTHESAAGTAAASAAGWAVGVDLGGTKIATVLVDLDGKILARDTRPTLPEEGYQAVIGRIVASVEKVVAAAATAAATASGASTASDAGDRQPPLVGIGVGSPGPIDRATGRVLFAPNLRWDNVPIVALLEEALQVPVYLDNDANLAGLGEARFGAARGYDNVFYITVSTGIGGGIIAGGQIYHGSHDAAGEVGHMTILPDGPTCGCGNRGCWEALASGTAIARRARDGLAAGESSSLRNLPEITARDVAEAAAAGDGYARRLIEETAFYLGIGVGNIINLFDPDIVVIGGGVSRIGEPLFAPLRAEAERRTVPGIRGRIRIEPAGLGQDSGVLGAAGLAIERWRAGQAGHAR